MSDAGSVTAWISALKIGNHEAAQQLWERYYHRLVKLARAKLHQSMRRVADEEDVALSAFDSFCRGAGQGRFPQLQDRNNLWPLLVVITARKSIDLVQREHAQKRGAGTVQGESAFFGFDLSSGGGIEQALGREPTPEFIVGVTEEYERLLGQLNEEKLKEIAILKMEGYTDKEVAAKLNCGLRTVERKLERIRRIWEKELTR